MSRFIIPELQYWFKQFLMKSNLNREHIPKPVEIPLGFCYRKSFIEMMFNDEYNLSEYSYMFLESNSPPNFVRHRMYIYTNCKYYDMSYATPLNDSTDAVNLFQLNSAEFQMLDKLLQFRLDPENTTLDGIGFDSTAYKIPTGDSTTFINYDTVDGTSGNLYVVDSTSSNLVDLIYLYLNMEINNDLSYYNNLVLITLNNTGQTPKEVLECCYESYVIEKYFNKLSQQAI